MIRIILIVLILVVVAGVVMVHHLRTPVNLMPSDSTSLKYWSWYQHAQARGRETSENGAIRIDILQVSEDLKDLAITHKGIGLEPGHRYRVSFSAKADRSHKIALDASGAYGGKWDAIGLNAFFLVDQNWNNYEKTFTASGPGSRNAVFPMFEVGDALGTVWIKDVGVEPLN